MMKLSDLDKIKPFRATLAELRAIEDGLTGYPPYDPIMYVKGNQLRLSNETALELVRSARRCAIIELHLLGVEADD